MMHIPPEGNSRYLQVSFLIPDEFEGMAINLLEELGFLGCETTSKDSGIIRTRAYFNYSSDTGIIRNSIDSFLCGIDSEKENPPESVIEFRIVNSPDWKKYWRINFPPIKVLPDVVVIAPWENIESFSEKYKLVINPGAAFGTSRHASTILTLKALSNSVNHGDYVLDFGSGSGILSIFAFLLGAALVDGIEIDQAAIKNAIENLKLNKIDRGIEFYTELNEVDDIRYNVVAANIDYPLIKKYLSILRERILSGGILILSGIEGDEIKMTESMLRDAGISDYNVERMDDWSSVIVKLS
ncbi:MAG: methyltransferase [candidate division Zixibacteria bacterium]|nr:methyltransferase [candidate division Zixibacteria bacterium]